MQRSSLSTHIPINGLVQRSIPLAVALTALTTLAGTLAFRRPCPAVWLSAAYWLVAGMLVICPLIDISMLSDRQALRESGSLKAWVGYAVSTVAFSALQWSTAMMLHFNEAFRESVFRLMA